jgi:hypothetical protein
LEATCCSERSVDFQRTTRRYIKMIELFVTTAVRTSHSTRKFLPLQNRSFHHRVHKISSLLIYNEPRHTISHLRILFMFLVLSIFVSVYKTITAPFKILYTFLVSCHAFRSPIHLHGVVQINKWSTLPFFLYLSWLLQHLNCKGHKLNYWLNYFPVSSIASVVAQHFLFSRVVLLMLYLISSLMDSNTNFYTSTLYMYFNFSLPRWGNCR